MMERNLSLGFRLSRECIRDTLLVKRNYGKHIPRGLIEDLYVLNIRALRASILKPHMETVLVSGRYKALQFEKRGNEPQWFGVVRWCEEDIKNALEINGLPATPHNIGKLHELCSLHGFEDIQIEAGWDYMYAAIAHEKGWEK